MTQLIVSTLLFCLLSAALPCSCDKIEDALQSRVTSSVAEPGDDSSENISTEGYEESVSATTVLKGVTSSLYFQYPGQTIWLRYSSNKTEYVHLNYSGPSATMSQYYTYDYQASSYLTSVANIATALDCFLVSVNRDYYFKFTSSGAGGAMWPVCIESLDETPDEMSAYVLHQSFDTSSAQGFHYAIEDYSFIDATSSTPTYATFANHNTTTYFNGIDTTHYFYDGALDLDDGSEITNWSDERTAVVNTQASEHSSIAFSEDTLDYRPVDKDTHVRTSLGYRYNRSSGTFISQTSVATCAHAFYAEIEPEENTNYLMDGAMPRRKIFYPGMNSYGYSSGFAYPYGKYIATEAYVSVSYLVSKCSFGDYELPCSKYDWALCETAPENGATLPVHSTMGLTAFTMPSGSFSYASFAGYGAIPHSMGENQYKYLQWKSPANRVVRTMVDGPNGSFLGSTAITNSGGHSGGPLYFYNATMENGQPVYHCQLIGITSGKRTLDTQTEPTLISYYVCASFFQLNSFFVNFAKEVAL